LFERRTYRDRFHHEGLVGFRVALRETDLQIAAVSDLSVLALEAVKEARAQLEAQIAAEPQFLTSLEPLPLAQGAPLLIRRMVEATTLVGVGPMAAVAGTVAEFVGERLLNESPEVIVENGGDIFLVTARERVIGLYAGDSPLSGKVGLRLPAGSRVGVCTSSATVGPSLSLGKADAALVIAPEAALADAAATGLGNRVQSPGDVAAALDWAAGVPGLQQAVVVIGETLGAWGQYELTPVAG
jgi:uncharacterized protein